MFEKILGKINKSYSDGIKTAKGFRGNPHEPEYFGGSWERRKRHFRRKAWYNGSGIVSASSKRR